MGYDLHVVRTRHWADAKLVPISKLEVEAVVAADPDLDWSSDDYIEMKDDSGSITRYLMINWNGLPSFWWYRDKILGSGLNEDGIRKLIDIAGALNAHVVGDDGEHYVLRQRILGGLRVTRVVPDA